MSDLFKLQIVHSQSHKIVPRIVFGILVVLAIIILIQSILKAKEENRPLFNFKDEKFFIENYDKKKFFGTAILLVLYIVFMKATGFIIASIIFLSLFNILYSEKKEPKDIGISIGIAIMETLIIWVIFGYIFDITLP